MTNYNLVKSIMAENQRLHAQNSEAYATIIKMHNRYYHIQYFLNKIPLLKTITRPVKLKHKLLKTQYRLQIAKQEIKRLQEIINNYEEKSRIDA